MEFNDHNFTRFVHEFSLLIEKEGVSRKVVKDPYGNKFSIAPTKLTMTIKNMPKTIYPEKEVDPDSDVLRDPNVFPLNPTKMNHIIRSINEFADFWQKRVLDTTISCHTDIDTPHKDNISIEVIWH